MKRISSVLGVSRQVSFCALICAVFLSLTACQHDIPELNGQPKIAINQKIEDHPFIVENPQNPPVSSANKGVTQ